MKNIDSFFWFLYHVIMTSTLFTILLILDEDGIRFYPFKIDTGISPRMEKYRQVFAILGCTLISLISGSIIHHLLNCVQKLCCSKKKDLTIIPGGFNQYLQKDEMFSFYTPMFRERLSYQHNVIPILNFNNEKKEETKKDFSFQMGGFQQLPLISTTRYQMMQRYSSYFFELFYKYNEEDDDNNKKNLENQLYNDLKDKDPTLVVQAIEFISKATLQNNKSITLSNSRKASDAGSQKDKQEMARFFGCPELISLWGSTEQEIYMLTFEDWLIQQDECFHYETLCPGKHHPVFGSIEPSFLKWRHFFGKQSKTKGFVKENPNYVFSPIIDDGNKIESFYRKRLANYGKFKTINDEKKKEEEKNSDDMNDTNLKAIQSLFSKYENSQNVYLSTTCLGNLLLPCTNYILLEVVPDTTTTNIKLSSLCQWIENKLKQENILYSKNTCAETKKIHIIPSHSYPSFYISQRVTCDLTEYFALQSIDTDCMVMHVDSGDLITNQRGELAHKTQSNLVHLPNKTIINNTSLPFFTVSDHTFTVFIPGYNSDRIDKQIIMNRPSKQAHRCELINFLPQNKETEPKDDNEQIATGQCKPNFFKLAYGL